MNSFKRISRGVFVGSLLVASIFAGTAKANRSLATFGPVTATVAGTDTFCSSYTNALVGSNVVFTCVSAGSPPMGAPTGCVAKMNNGISNVALPSSGGTVALSVTCVSPGSGIVYNWSRNGQTGVSSLASWSDIIGANASSLNNIVVGYQVEACVSSNCVTVPAGPINAIVAHTTGSTTTWNGQCSGFSSTVVADLNWVTPTRLYPAMGPNDIIVVRFTTGASPSLYNLPRIAGAEFNSSPSGRVATLSKTPCDFNSTFTVAGAHIGTDASPSNSPTAVFALGGGPDYSYYPNLLLNTVYYLNIKNAPNSTCASSGVCDMFIDLIKTSL